MARDPDHDGEDAPVSRRDFLRKTCFVACGACLAGLGVEKLLSATQASTGDAAGKLAMWWEPLGDGRTKCALCPRRCVVKSGERGECGARENRRGAYYTLVHGWVSAANVDHIEKKPFFHFLPGTAAFSIATAGCNMHCRDCQNWELSQSRPERVERMPLAPKDVAQLAAQNSCRSIAYTYNEPNVFYEYVYDCAVAGRKRGVRSVIVSNGYINHDPLARLLPYLDAVKIDLKGFSDVFYRRYTGGTLRPVLDNLRTVRKSGKWLEIVYLVVPTINDDPRGIDAMCAWVRDNLGRDVPLHFSQFHPDYKLKNLPPTPYSTLEDCWKRARAAGLHYVYLGNVPGSPAEHTYCPACGRAVIERVGFTITTNHLNGGRCGYCNKTLPGVWR
jgi:pyruvate formate lyase activating enzyme